MTGWQLEYSGGTSWYRSSAHCETFGDALQLLIRVYAREGRLNPITALRYRLTHPAFFFAGVVCDLQVRR